MKAYRVIISDQIINKTDRYLEQIKSGKTPGKYLSGELERVHLDEIPNKKFLELLINTKKPRIFAESAVSGDGSDWNQKELSILGDLSIAVPVTVYDNGLHANPRVHQEPFSAHLIFVPGALLRNDRGGVPADWNEVTSDGELDPEGYYHLYERRLLPALRFASDWGENNNQNILITIPGIGCGQFSGPFHHQLGERLKKVLMKLLENYGRNLSSLRAVYYDPYRECQNERHEIHGSSLLVRPLTQGNYEKPQLCPPHHYEENGDDFSAYHLFSLVAWDHVSWPGNDFYARARTTDDGVKAAATDSMQVITGVKGFYDPERTMYLPPDPYQTWGQVVRETGCQLKVGDNLLIYS